LPIEERREVAVNKSPGNLAQALIELQPNTTDRLRDLLSSFSALRSSNRNLVAQLRGSIYELREHRRRLKQQHVLEISAERPIVSQSDLSKEFGLTRREAEVAELLSQGRSNQAIARELRISEHTARHHTQRILSKLEVHSRGEAGAKLRGVYLSSPR
jgi:DNA-binding NarL/FixJ family response regulator